MTTSTAKPPQQAPRQPPTQPGPEAPLRVLVLVQGQLSEKMSGPEIRGFEIAKALAGRHRVTAAVRAASVGARDGVAVVPFTRRRILREALRHDVVIAPCVPPFLFAVKAIRSLRLVSDLYDPVEVELATVAGLDREARVAGAALRIQLRFADLVLCAGTRQRQRLEGELGASAATKPLRELPFGLPAPPPPSSRRPLRERFAAIAEEDTVVLWWGSIWPWLDAEGAIRAFEAVAEARPDVKLVFASGRRAGAHGDRLSAAEAARELARERGLLDHSVFFIDDWIPYDERHQYLQEADLGLVLHRDTPEAKLAARARYMDYLWAGLPCVLARGDEIADRFAAAGFATLVPANEPPATTSALLRALDDPSWLSGARGSSTELAREYEWASLVRPLEQALEAPEPPPRLSLRDLAALAGRAGAYYARRLGDRLAASRS
jgi:glycosyltransferase involved in cell wall biosynthesis